MSNIQHARRRFLRFGVIGFITSFFSGLPKIASANVHVKNDNGIVVHEEDGIHIIMGRSKAKMTIKISRGEHGIEGVSFCTEDIIPGRKIPVHKHLNNDEVIFIHKGEGLFTLNEQTIEVKTGTVVFVPRGVWHGLQNTGSGDLRMVFQYTPAGFEQYFIENGTPAGMTPKERTREEYAVAEKKYGMVYKEPR